MDDRESKRAKMTTPSASSTAAAAAAAADAEGGGGHETQEEKKKLGIKWSTDGTGWETRESGAGMVLTVKKALQRCAIDVMAVSMREWYRVKNSFRSDDTAAASSAAEAAVPEHDTSAVDKLFVHMLRGFTSFALARPWIGHAQANTFLRAIRREVHPIVTQLLLEAHAAKGGDVLALAPSEPDCLFMAVLGQTRDYRAGCVICLSDHMMGTTCGCGHTEIVVFRPCGHSVCVKPCFEQFAASKSAKLGPTIMTTADGQQFEVVGAANVDEACGFPCPTCRSMVQQCFRAEETHIPSGYQAEALREAVRTAASEASIYVTRD
jgi:hypothetical protein